MKGPFRRRQRGQGMVERPPSQRSGGHRCGERLVERESLAHPDARIGT